MVLALTGARDALCTGSGLERLVGPHVSFGRQEDAPIPLHLVTTDLLTGEEVQEAEIAVVQHYATEDQQRRVRAMAGIRTREGRRQVWMAYDSPRAVR